MKHQQIKRDTEMSLNVMYNQDKNMIVKQLKKEIKLCDENIHKTKMLFKY